jgi:hypothetical protein
LRSISAMVAAPGSRRRATPHPRRPAPRVGDPVLRHELPGHLLQVLALGGVHADDLEVLLLQLLPDLHVHHRSFGVAGRTSWRTKSAAPPCRASRRASPAFHRGILRSQSGGGGSRRGEGLQLRQRQVIVALRVPDRRVEPVVGHAGAGGNTDGQIRGRDRLIGLDSFRLLMRQGRPVEAPVRKRRWSNPLRAAFPGSWVAVSSGPRVAALCGVTTDLLTRTSLAALIGTA